MKLTTLLTFVVWLSVSSFAPAASMLGGSTSAVVVVPNVSQTIDDGGGSGLLNTQLRHQIVYHVSQLPLEVIRITELRMRPSSAYGNAFTSTIPNLQINLSTTSVEPNQMNSVFAQNVGTNDTVVFQGPLTVSSRFVGPANGPKEFDILIPLTTPFVYDPSRGNLLIDFRNVSGSGATFVDAGQGTDDGSSRAFALTADASTAAAADVGAEVFQIVYSVVTGVAPAITINPHSRNALMGETVTLEVVATGTPPLNYQWLKEGAVLIGAIGSSLTLTNIQSTDAGFYRVVVSNSYGAVVSQIASITVSTNVPVVVPSVSQTVDDGGGSGLLNTQLRQQLLYEASQFPFQLIRIAELRMRPSSRFGHAFTSTIPNLQINLSSTTVGPNQMNSVFAQNLGTNDTVVFQGPLTVSSRFVGPANGPKEFDIIIPLTTPFVYDPTRGNLLIDFRNFSGSSAAFVDIGQRTDDGSSRAFSLSASATEAATRDPGAEVFQILYSVAGGIAPTITTNPQSHSTFVGETVTLNAAASGTPPLMFQWLKGGAPLTGATGTLLTLTNVQVGDAGSYSIIVSNAYGAATSQIASVTVDVLRRYDLSLNFSLASNPNGVWSYGRQDTIGGSFTLLGLTQTNLAQNGVPILVRLMNPNTQPAILHNDTTQTATTTGGGSYPPETTWLAPGVQGQPGNYVVARFTTPAGGDGTYRLITTARPAYGDTVQRDTDFHVLRSNAEIFGAALTGAQTIEYTNDLAIAAGETVDFVVGRGADNNYTWSQLKVEATLQQISTNGVPPAIVSQPSDQTTFEGGSVSFSVIAFGSSQLGYQWLRDTTAIPGATNATLTLSNAQPSQAGSYSVVVSNVFGVETSRAAMLTVHSAPENAAVVPRTAENTETPYGSGTLRDAGIRNQQVYGSIEFPQQPMLIEQLRFRPDARFGSAFSTTVSNIQINLSTTQRNPGSLSSTFSQNVGADDRVVFQGALSISSQFFGPTNGPKAFDIVVPLEQPYLYDPAGGNLVIDIRNFSGSAASRVSGQTGPDSASRVIGGAAAATGTVDVGADAIQVVFTPATNLAPRIVAQPTSQAVVVGSNVTFSVTVVGSAPLTYHWRFNGVPIAGATSASLAITNVGLSNAGIYSVIVENDAGIAFSSEAVLSIVTEGSLIVPAGLQCVRE